MLYLKIIVGERKKVGVMDFLKEQIDRILPHEKNALMLDRAYDVEPGYKAKTQTFIDPIWFIFEGHFPGKPMLPGVYITEMMAQAAGVMLLTLPENEGLYPVLFQIKQMTYLQPVLPGKVLDIQVECVQDGSQGFYECKAKAYVGGQRVAAGTLTLCLRT